MRKEADQTRKTNASGWSGTCTLREWMFLLLVFALSYTQMPLYRHNQNPYFLHGLARAGLGFLNQDWLSATADPHPVFSLLVEFTYRSLPEGAFHVYYLILLGLYAYSIMGIAGQVFHVHESRLKFYLYFGLVAAMHSPAWSFLWTKLASLELLHAGVAGQYTLGPVFQPCVFGVFLLFSVQLFLRGRPSLAVFFSCLAAVFHASYLLCAAWLTLTYMGIVVRGERNYVKALQMGLLGLATVFPILAYDYLTFLAVSKDTLFEAQRILVDFRIPHHAQPTYWFTRSSVFQIGVVLLGLALMRKTKIFPILLPCVLAAALFTAIQILTQDRFLALLFPWRCSVFLVPICSSLILARGVSFFFQSFPAGIHRVEKGVWVFVVSLLAILPGCGLAKSYEGYREIIRQEGRSLMEYAAANRKADHLYLIPPDLEDFRINTGVPIFVDRKSHPFKDVEVVEWFMRIQMARRFYRSSGPAGESLERIRLHSPITHAVVKNGSLDFPCASQREVYRDFHYAIYRVGSGSSGGNCKR